VNEQLTEVARKLRQLGDLRHEASVDQCRLLGPLWGDRKALAELAKALEASEAKLRKWAGAGVIIEAGWAPEDRAIEWYYQLSLWPMGDWERMYELDGLVELSAADLKALRVVSEKLGMVGKALVMQDVVDEGPGDYDYSATEEDWQRLEETGYHLEGDETVVPEGYFEEVE